MVVAQRDHLDLVAHYDLHPLKSVPYHAWGVSHAASHGNRHIDPNSYAYDYFHLQ